MLPGSNSTLPRAIINSPRVHYNFVVLFTRNWLGWSEACIPAQYNNYCLECGETRKYLQIKTQNWITEIDQLRRGNLHSQCVNLHRKSFVNNGLLKNIVTKVIFQLNENL